MENDKRRPAWDAFRFAFSICNRPFEPFAGSLRSNSLCRTFCPQRREFLGHEEGQFQ